MMGPRSRGWARTTDMQIQSLPFFQLNYPGMVATDILHCRGGFLQPPRPRVATAVGRRLAVAVGTQHSEVLKAVVIPYPIYMVQVHAERSSLPVLYPA